MRARIVVSFMLLFAAFSALSGEQVVVTEDASTSSLAPKTNYGISIALIVGSGSNTHIKFSFATPASDIWGSCGICGLASEGSPSVELPRPTM